MNTPTHPLDPEVKLSETLAWVQSQHPLEKRGAKVRLAKMLGVTKGLISIWASREDDLIPAPWNWRVRALQQQCDGE